ncbi:MAG: YheT family hydrolase [Oleiphilus sp.]
MYFTRTNYRVTGVLANPHIQSLLASSKLRRRLKFSSYAPLIENQSDVILHAGEKTRLHGFYSKALFRPLAQNLPASTLNLTHPPRSKGKIKKLAILIHGWEGSADSTYLLSAAGSLYSAGYSVFRLHLRDHGPSAQLNEALFHAARLEEVALAIQDIQHRFDYDEYFLVGFSLGANFALRVGMQAERYGLDFQHIVAISPVLCPASTMKALTDGPFIYRKYFLKKWRKALKQKEQLFPELYDFGELAQSTNLSAMTEHLVRVHTDFENVTDYFNSYTLTQDQLEKISIKTDLVLAEDDPVIPIDSSSGLSSSEHLRLRVFKHGGHCGFIKNWRGDSWVDRELLSLFSL